MLLNDNTKPPLELNPYVLPEPERREYWADTVHPGYNVPTPRGLVFAGTLGGAYLLMRGMQITPAVLLAEASTGQRDALQRFAAFRVYERIRKTEKAVPMLSVFRLSELSSRYAGPSVFKIDQISLSGTLREAQATRTYLENLLGSALTPVELEKFSFDNIDWEAMGGALTFEREAGSAITGVSPFYRLLVKLKGADAGDALEFRVKAQMLSQGATSKIAEAAAARHLGSTKELADEFLMPEGIVKTALERLEYARSGRGGALRALIADERLGKFGEYFYKTLDFLDIGRTPIHGNVFSESIGGKESGSLYGLASNWYRTLKDDPNILKSAFSSEDLDDVLNVIKDIDEKEGIEYVIKAIKKLGLGDTEIGEITRGITPISAYRIGDDDASTLLSRLKSIAGSPTLDHLAKRTFEQLSSMPKVGKLIGLSPSSMTTWQSTIGNVLMKRILPAYVGWKVGSRLFHATGAKDALIGMWKNLTLGVATISDSLGITKWKKDLEEKFPGMSQPISHIGLLASGAFVGAASSMAMTGWKKATLGVDSKELLEYTRSSKMLDAIKIVRESGELDKTLYDGVLGGVKRFAHEIVQDVNLRREALKDVDTGEIASTARGVFEFVKSTTRGKVLAGAAIGLAISLPFAIRAGPTLLAPEHTTEELHELHEGERNVPVRKGRWWELSFTPWHGEKVTHFKPHWTHMYLSDYKTAALWGSREEMYKYDPFWHPIKAIFGSDEWKYQLEYRHYQDRPYPVSGRRFADVPIVGSILASTVGELVKPTKKFHVDEWETGHGPLGTQYKWVDSASRSEPVPELAAAYGGYRKDITGRHSMYTHGSESSISAPRVIAPMRTTGFQYTAGEIFSRAVTETPGFPGFLIGATKEKITGSGDIFDRRPVLASADRMDTIERSYWDQEYGGLLSLTEHFRRVIVPSPRRKLETYNPLKSAIAERHPWLPGESHYIDFTRGDVYCVSGETLIEIDDYSFVPAAQVKIGDIITSHKGNKLPVRNIRKRNINDNEKVYQLNITSLHGSKIQASESHPFLVCTNTKARSKKPVRSKRYEIKNTILDILTKSPGITTKDIQKYLGISITYVYQLISELIRDNKVYKDVNRNRELYAISCNYDMSLVSNGLEWKQIQDIKIGDYVAYPRPKHNPVDYTFDLARYLPDVACTDKYIYCCMKKESRTPIAYEYIEEHGCNFDRGERITVSKELGITPYDIECAQMLVRRNSVKRVPRYVVLDEDIAYALGLYLADGWLQYGVVAISQHVKASPLFDRFLMGISKLHPDINSNTDIIKDTNTIALRAHSIVAETVVRNDIGVGSSEKRIPYYILNSSEDIIRSFIKGYCDGDGSLYIDNSRKNISRKPRPVVTFVSINKTVLLQVRKLLLEYGFVTSLTLGTKKNTQYIYGKQCKRSPSYSLTCRGKTAVSLATWLGYDCPKHLINFGIGATWSYVTSNYIFMRVNSILEVDIDTVYGFEVDTDNSFCVSGVATHNTKIPIGEARLPGPGYERLHPEIVERGYYTDEDKFRILANVAPYSGEYKQHAALIRNRLARGVYSKEESQQLLRSFDEANIVKQGHEFSDYQWKQSKIGTVTKEVVVKEVVAPGVFTTVDQPERRVSLEGVNISNTALRRLHGGTGFQKAMEQRDELLDTYITPGKPLTLMMSEDPLWQYSASARDPQVRAIALSHGKNINKMLIDKELAEKKDSSAGFRNYVNPKFGDAAIGTAWETISHANFPMVAKTMHKWTALEQYERHQVYGRPVRLWQKPWKHIVKPMITGGANRYLGYDSVPKEVRERRDINEYFDKIEWLKWHRLETAATEEGQAELADIYRGEKKKTLFGADPYGDTSSLYSAIPKPEQEYFRAFSEAATHKERMRILEVVPEDVGRLLSARWEQRTSANLMAEMDYLESIGKKGSKEYRNALKTVNTIARRKAAEGMEIDDKLWKEYTDDYLNQNKENMLGYADWMRMRKLDTYFKDKDLPEENWIGWYPGVAMEDIKFKYVEREGLDFHDFNLWESREQQLPRKPYLGGSTKLLDHKRRSIMRSSSVMSLANSKGIGQIIAKASHGNISNVELRIDRSTDIDRVIYYSGGEFQRYRNHYGVEGSW